MGRKNLTLEERRAHRRRIELAVYNKGVAAKAAGKRLQDCPYTNARTSTGNLTFGRYWRTLWFRGYHGKPING